MHVLQRCVPQEAQQRTLPLREAKHSWAAHQMAKAQQQRSEDVSLCSACCMAQQMHSLLLQLVLLKRWYRPGSAVEHEDWLEEDWSSWGDHCQREVGLVEQVCRAHGVMVPESSSMQLQQPLQVEANEGRHVDRQLKAQ